MLQPGTVFAGDYEVVKPLSQGGMGAVFVVKQLSTGKLRALKLMHRELVYDPESRQRFEQEARIGSRIASEHIVEVVAAGYDPQTRVPYLVMELLEGEDMMTRLRRGPFSLGEARRVLEQLAHALGAAHDAGVVHRDLKPENIFLGVSRRTGQSLVVKVLDFGIAKVSEDQRRTTGAYGTPLWLSPEQTHRGEITPAADVWSLGLVVFMMLTGHIFWRAADRPDASLRELIDQILNQPIPLASSRAAEFSLNVPPGLDVWLARALDRDPRNRFQNARIAWSALAPILDGTATAETTFAETPPPPQPPKRSIVLPIVLTLVGLVVVAGIAVASAAIFVAHTAKTPVVTAEPAPTPTPTPTPTRTLMPTPTPTPIASAAPPEGHINCFMQSKDTEIQDDFVERYRSKLASQLEDCLVTEPSTSFIISVKLKTDGTVASAQMPVANLAHATCLTNAVKQTQFAPAKHASDVMMMCSWKK